MQPTIYLEFSYTPDNYFEETLHEEKENYRLEIEGGKIKAILKESGNERNSDFFDRIHKEIEAFFIAVQIVTHKKYILSRHAFFKEYPDGRKDKNVFTKSARLLLVESTADIKITKPDGIIIQDTKRERLE